MSLNDGRCIPSHYGPRWGEQIYEGHFFALMFLGYVHREGDTESQIQHDDF